MADFKKQYLSTRSGASSRDWYVVYAKPRQENLAQLNLERQGYETYLPRIAVPRRRDGQIIQAIEPFFPRYLFICLDREHDNWAPLRSTRGVCSLVRFEGVPKPIDSSFIDALKDNENSERLQRITAKSWKRGEQLAIEQGPFAGYHCIFQEMRGSDRVTVLFNVIGKLTRATLQLEDLQLPRFA